MPMLVKFSVAIVMLVSFGLLPLLWTLLIDLGVNQAICFMLVSALPFIIAKIAENVLLKLGYLSKRNPIK